MKRLMVIALLVTSASLVQAQAGSGPLLRAARHRGPQVEWKASATNDLGSWRGSASKEGV